MKTLVLALAAAAAMAATAASAAPVTSTTVVPLFDGAGGFTTNIAPSTSFNDDYDITVGKSGLFDVSVTMEGTVSISSVTLNGVALSYFAPGKTYYTDADPVSAGTQVLDVIGSDPSKTHGGDVSGSVSFTSAAPEASTWALMIAGVAMAGSALRLSRKKASGLLAV